MPEPHKKKRGQPLHVPDEQPFLDPTDAKVTFGTHRVCSMCKGTRHRKGRTDLPCRTCGGTGYEVIVPLRRVDPPPG